MTIRTSILLRRCRPAADDAITFWLERTAFADTSIRKRTLIALPQVDNASAEPPATMTFTGTFVFNFTLTVKSNISSTAKIQCTATATLLDVGSWQWE